MDKLFVIIARINHILLLLALIGACILMVLAVWTDNRWERRGAIEVVGEETASSSPIYLHLGQIENIAGADTQMMTLQAHEESGELYSGSGYSSEIRNVLFLSGTEKHARWLFPKQNNVILVERQLSESSDNTKENPTRALYFEYVAEDTNNDGMLSDQDLSTVALAKPDGTGFTTVLSGVNNVLSSEMINDTQFSIVYQMGKIVRHARFSVTTLTKEIDQEIISVPDKL
jgi:hypothetical protein